MGLQFPFNCLAMRPAESRMPKSPDNDSWSEVAIDQKIPGATNNLE